MSQQTVLISGAGIAGPTLAFWLKAAGFAPTLIERAPALRSGGYVIDFWGLGYDIAERMGLRRAIHDIGYHMRELRIVDDRGRRVAGFGTRVFDELTGGRFVTLGRSDLSRLLYEKIEGEIEILFDEEVIDLQDEAEGARVRLQRAGERRFDLVIGADGLHSEIRRLAFGPQDQFERQLHYAVAAFEVRGYERRDEDTYLIRSEPGHMLGRFALRDDRTLFLLVFATNGSSLPATLDRQKALLGREYGGDRGEVPRVLELLEGIDELYFDRVSQIRMPRWSKGHVALAGDAAFCVSLMAGQGSALAIAGAYVLAGELARAGGDCGVAFSRYESLMRDYIERKQRAAEKFAVAFAPRTQWGLWVRNQVIKAFAIPGLSRLAVGRDIVDRLVLPDYRWPSLDARTA
ncbi:MAG TPA: FAD-binding domain [Stellaceae bacterium]|nr:FAD-binding domain [Stellaceae bacterium]